MYIGSVSQKTGFSRDTIRFYEKKGLIELDPQDRYPNNYKNYSVDIVKRLLMIREMKQFGFTLNEIKTILKNRDDGKLDCKKGEVEVRQRISEIDKQIKELQNKRRRLMNTIRNCPNPCKVKNTLNEIEEKPFQQV